MGTVYVLGGFALFVLCCVLLHYYLKREERKKINDNLLSDILGNMNRRGTVFTVVRKQSYDYYYDVDDDDDVVGKRGGVDLRSPSVV